MRDIDWDNRVLCSDESCIGVIGVDGRCKECGKAYEGELPFSAAPDEDSTPDEAADETVATEEPATEPVGAASETDYDADDWDKRTLCSDESCIGVIGPDGHCKECGKPYTG
jgi:hypothetical protein